MKPIEAFSPAQQWFRRQVAEELRRFMKTVDGSPTVFARRIGKSREYCSRVLSGRFVPSWQVLADLTQSYGYAAEVGIRKRGARPPHHRGKEPCE